MMAAMLALDGVETGNFDFCSLRMQTRDEHGKLGAARKRTKVLTNSRHVAEALRRCQCPGHRLHIPLENGKANECEKYTEMFSELIVKALMREMADIEWLETIKKNVENGATDVTEKFEKIMAAVAAAETLGQSSNDSSRSAGGWCPCADEAAVPKPPSEVSAALPPAQQANGDVVIPPHDPEEEYLKGLRRS